MKRSLLALMDPEQVANSLDAGGVAGCDVGTLELQRAWPNGRDGLSAVFAVGDDLWSIHTAPSAPPRSVRAAIERRRAFQLPGLECWAHRFPEDPELPQLRDVFRPEPSLPGLRRHLPRQWDGRGTRAVTYKPRRRCVVSFADGAVLLKLFRPGRMGDVAARYSALARNAEFGAMRVALPDAVCADSDGLLWHATAGEPLLAKLGKPEGEGFAAAVGNGLAKLQQSTIPWTDQHDASDEIETVASWVAAASAAFPHAEERLEQLRRCHARAAPPAHAKRLVPAHRDFHDGQILAAGGGLVLVDLDTACHAPAELDVGNFLAHLRLRALEGNDARWGRINSAFLSGYAESAGHDAIEPGRLRWYEAGALLRLACVYAFRPRWTALSDRLLNDSRECLESNALKTGVVR